VGFADVSGFVPVRADLLGVCDGSSRAVWCVARDRDGGMAVAAVSSFCEGWTGSGGEERFREAHSFARSTNEWGTRGAVKRDSGAVIIFVTNSYYEMMS